MAITAVDEYCMREIERFPVKRTTYRAQLFFTVSSIPFDRRRVWREPIFMVHSQRTNCLVFLSRDRELSPRGGTMVVTWSFFIGCDLHVATLSEIGRTSFHIYIYSWTFCTVALRLSSLFVEVKFFSLAGTRRERWRDYFFLKSVHF